MSEETIKELRSRLTVVSQMLQEKKYQEGELAFILGTLEVICKSLLEIVDSSKPQIGSLPKPAIANTPSPSRPPFGPPH